MKTTDALNTDRLLEALGRLDAPPLGLVLDCCDSTNAEAKRRILAEGTSPAIIAANTQTAGRGRLGRSFYSPAQTGVYFSILYPVTAPLSGVVSLTGACAVAVMRAIRGRTGIQTEIKWVNDLYLDGKKVCGILAEALSMGDKTHLIVGIGINLSTSIFPQELQEKAGSLDCHNVPRAELIAEIYQNLLPFLTTPSDRSWLDDYRKHSMVIGRSIEWLCGEERHEGIAVGINGDGELEVRLPDGGHTLLRTGEISIKIK